MPKRKFTSAEIWMVNKNGTRVGRLRKHKIFLISKNKGRIVKDGREVVKINGTWVYISK